MLYFAVLFLMFAGAAGWAAFAAGAPIELLKLLYGFFAIMAILCLAGTITGRRRSPANPSANLGKPDLA
jgi:TctA family transporter